MLACMDGSNRKYPEVFRKYYLWYIPGILTFILFIVIYKLYFAVERYVIRCCFPMTTDFRWNSPPPPRPSAGLFISNDHGHVCPPQLSFNHSALDCVVRDTNSDSNTNSSTNTGDEGAGAGAGGGDAIPGQTADLALPAGGLLRLDVGVCIPWEALPSWQPLRLVGARVLMRYK